ncbi:MAG: hypothetical protein KGK14_01640 [Bacteroidota bacterium]|jgi:hypothetical protein|nr:hypothetical protein [Bacteroidota bacterium]
MTKIIFIGMFLLLFIAIDLLPFQKYVKGSLKCYQQLYKPFFQYQQVSDFYKQKFILGYSARLFKNSLYLLALLVGVIGLFLLSLFAIGFIYKGSKYLFNYLLSWQAFWLSVITFIFYFIVKKMYERI